MYDLFCRTRLVPVLGKALSWVEYTQGGLCTKSLQVWAWFSVCLYENRSLLWLLNHNCTVGDGENLQPEEQRTTENAQPHMISFTCNYRECWQVFLKHQGPESPQILCLTKRAPLTARRCQSVESNRKKCKKYMQQARYPHCQWRHPFKLDHCAYSVILH